MQKTSEAPAEHPDARRDRGHEALAVDPKREEAAGERHLDPSLPRNGAGSNRARVELEPDIGPDRGE